VGVGLVLRARQGWGWRGCIPELPGGDWSCVMVVSPLEQEQLRLLPLMDQSICHDDYNLYTFLFVCSVLCERLCVFLI
jgi:hypothetical protein